MKPLGILLFFLIVLASGCELIVEETIFHDERNRLVGDYEVEEYSETEGITFYYDVSIYKSGFYNEIIIHNLYDSGLDVFAQVYENGKKIRIPLQSIDDLEFEGAGTLYNREELSLTYVVHDYHFDDFLSAVAWKY